MGTEVCTLVSFLDCPRLEREALSDSENLRVFWDNIFLIRKG
jgi:hypothetical protein